MNYQFERLTTELALEVASDILPADWEECKAWTGTHPGEALVAEANSPRPAWVVIRKGSDTPVLVFGCSTSDNKVLDVWCMATSSLRLKDAVQVRKRMDNVILAMGGQVGIRGADAMCIASQENLVHRRWLDAVGFFPTGRTETRNGVEFMERMYVRT